MVFETVSYTHCCYCRRKFDTDTLDLNSTDDHFIPRSKFGLNGENILKACRECNIWKGCKMPEDWLKQVEKYFDKKKKFRQYELKHYAQIIGSLRHWIKHFKGKEISKYKY